ncbi:unnamed protein product, partial [Polarella glacialis]
FSMCRDFRSDSDLENLDADCDVYNEDTAVRPLPAISEELQEEVISEEVKEDAKEEPKDTDLLAIIQELPSDTAIEVFFDATLTKGVKPWGMTYESADKNLLLVSSVNESGTAVADWNASCSNNQKLKVSDRILGVNGHAGSADVLRKMITDSSGKVVLSIRRAVLRELTFNKNGKSVGLELNYVPNLSRTLMIIGIKDGGAIKALNDTATPETLVQIGSHIIRVNDSSDVVADEMLKSLRENEEVTLVLATWP